MCIVESNPISAVIARESGRSSIPQQIFGARSAFRAPFVVNGLPACAGNDGAR
jgi:hypothetical protein